MMTMTLGWTSSRKRILQLMWNKKEGKKIMIIKLLARCQCLVLSLMMNDAPSY